MSYSFKKENKEIEAQLNYIKAISQQFAISGDFISSTEFGCMMNNLVIGVRRLADRLGKAERRQMKTLLNVTPFDIKETKKLISDLEYYVTEAQSSESDEDDKDWREEVNTENLDAPFTLSDGCEAYTSARIFLMKNIKPNLDKFKTEVREIEQHLKYTEEYLSSVENDEEKCGKVYNQMLESFQEEEWGFQKVSFVSQIKNKIEEGKNKGLCEDEILQKELEDLRAFYINVSQSKNLRMLYETVVDGSKSPLKVIINLREELTEDDISNYFKFLCLYNMLKGHIDSLPLLQPADNEYKNLFVNRASQELAFLLATTIGNYVDFRHNYQYAALQMAMQDLRLVYSDGRNGIQMRDYINKAYLKNDKLIKDQKTLTDWTGKLLGSMFGAMDESHLLGNYSLEDFEKMKDYYWLCVSIINKIVQLDLKELQFAPYLHEEHEKTPSINDYKNSEGQSIMERLSILKSVFKGETLIR